MEVRFPSDTRYLHMAHQLTKRLAEASGFGAAEAEKIALAVDEATTNVIQHAYGSEPDHEIEVHFDPRAESLEIVILHDGEALEAPPVPAFDLDRLVAQRKRGGLGLAIMAEMMDRVEHSTAKTGRQRCVLVRYKKKNEKRRRRD